MTATIWKIGKSYVFVWALALTVCVASTVCGSLVWGWSTGLGVATLVVPAALLSAQVVINQRRDVSTRREANAIHSITILQNEYTRQGRGEVGMHVVPAHYAWRSAMEGVRYLISDKIPPSESKQKALDKLDEHLAHGEKELLEWIGANGSWPDHLVYKQLQKLGLLK